MEVWIPYRSLFHKNLESSWNPDQTLCKTLQGTFRDGLDESVHSETPLERLHFNVRRQLLFKRNVRAHGKALSMHHSVDKSVSLL